MSEQECQCGRGMVTLGLASSRTRVCEQCYRKDCKCPSLEMKDELHIRCPHCREWLRLMLAIQPTWEKKELKGQVTNE